MAKCPKCGTEVSSPKKKWTMAGRPDKAGKKMQLEIGLFDCPKCHKPFRVVLSKRKIQNARKKGAQRVKHAKKAEGRTLNLTVYQPFPLFF